ncbi:MAG: tetratricopeptide repeat protein [Kofleriaceae bacterium]
MKERSRCPSQAVVERAYWTRDVAIDDHLTSCERCRKAWQEIESLASVGSKIEPATWTRQEEVRTALLSLVEHDTTPARTFAWPRRWLAPLAVALAAAFAFWWAWPSTLVHAPVVSQHRAVVLEHDGVRSYVLTEQPDEIIRLISGTITVAVPVLAANERVRVITGEDEIDASSAAFDATAENDKLATVRVLHGEVKLLAAGQNQIVRAGKTWHATTQLAVVTPDAAPSVTPPTPAAHDEVVIEPEVPRAKLPAPAPSPSPPPEEPPTIEPVEPTPEPSPPARSAAQEAFEAGWSALRAGDYAKAAPAFERARTRTVDPTMIEDATFWRGVALARSGEVVTAVHVLSAYAREYPRAVRIGEAHSMLGWLYFERGDHANAEQHFAAAVKDSSPRIRDSARMGLAEIAKRKK